MSDDKRLLLLNANDNVLVCCQALSAGSELVIDGRAITLSTALAVGHKVARHTIEEGEKVIRYGVSIGSATSSIRIGEHVHIHNLKSDYTQSHHRDAVEGKI